jgi:hypothetical protein
MPSKFAKVWQTREPKGPMFAVLSEQLPVGVARVPKTGAAGCNQLASAAVAPSALHGRGHAWSNPGLQLHVRFICLCYFPSTTQAASGVTAELASSVGHQTSSQTHVASAVLIC